MDGAPVLVTGGAGFIGANLVRLLVAQGQPVRVFDDFSVGSRRHFAGLDVEILEGDVGDRDAVRGAVADVSGVVHLAAQTGVPGSLIDPMGDCSTNVVGTLNLLEASRIAGVRRFVFASSNAPLGRQAPPAAEDKVPLPVSPYGASKLAGEAYCLAYYGSWGMGTVILRFANVYGPFSGHKESVVALFMRNVLAGRPLVVDGDGGQTRDFIFVEDLCRAIQLALDTTLGGEVFQVATGVETSIRELVDLIRSVSGSEVELARREPRRGDIRRNYSRISKAGKQLGWTPTTDLAAGLTATWEWFQSHAND